MGPSDNPLVEAQDPPPGLDSYPKLSKGFIAQLAARNDGIVNPIVRVLACDIKYETAGYKKDHHNVRRARLLLWDGSDKVCLGVTVSNLLYEVKTQLTKGQPIIQLTNYQATEYADRTSQEEEPRYKLGILVTQYQFLFCLPLDDVDESNYTHAYMSDDDAEADTLNTQTIADTLQTIADTLQGRGALQNPTTAFHHRIIEFQKRTDVRILPEASTKLCSPQCRLCSRHGQRFHGCLAEQYETSVKSNGFLESISEQCFFVDRDGLCTVGIEQKDATFIVWGDSHGRALAPTVDASAKRARTSGVIATNSG